MDTIRVMVLIILVITVLIVIITKPRHTVRVDPDTWKHASSRIVTPIESKALVVARYGEELEWLKDEDIRDMNVYIYNKGKDTIVDSRFIYIKLDNVGVCDHTYLHHIVTRYDNLEDVTVFLPASCTLLFKIPNKNRVFEHYDRFNSYFSNVGEYPNIHSFSLDTYQLSDPRNRDGKVSKMIPCSIRPYGKWYKHIMNRELTHHRANMGAIFSASKETIRRYPKEFYQRLISYLDRDRFPEAAHYMERLWYDIYKLDIVFYTVFIGTDSNVANQVNSGPSHTFDCYFFSNNRKTLEKAKRAGWSIVYVDITPEDDVIDSNMKAKYFKVLPHKLDVINKYQWSVFVDSKRYVNTDIILEECINTTKSFNIVPHTFIKTSPYLDREISESLKQDRYMLQKDRIMKYVNTYKTSYEPSIYFGCSIILRRTNDPINIKICEEWYKHIQECGIQDQISFYFITLMYQEHIGALNERTFIA